MADDVTWSGSPAKAEFFDEAMVRDDRSLIPVDTIVPPDLTDDLRAERWLITQHGPDWYIGDATPAEWTAAYKHIGEEL